MTREMRLAAALLMVASAMVPGRSVRAQGRSGVSRQSAAQIDTSPIATFREVAGEPLFQVAGAILLDSTVLIAERSSARLHLFRRTGEYLRSVGGKGHGPGEFQFIYWVQRVSRQIYVFDRDQRRLSVFTDDGSFVRSVALGHSPVLGIAMPLGVFRDGSILALALRPSVPTTHPDVRRSMSPLLHYTADGKFLDSLGVFKGSESFVQPWGRGGELNTSLVLGRSSAVAMRGVSYCTLENDSLDIECSDAKGAKLASLAPAGVWPKLFVTKADIAIVCTRFTEQKGGPSDMGALFDRMPLPSVFPYYGWSGTHRLSFLKSTSAGDIWALHFGGVRSLTPVWSVFAADGKATSVTSLQQVEVLDASSTVALVLTWDPDGVETVQLRRLR